jgi:hypothetical protein
MVSRRYTLRQEAIGKMMQAVAYKAGEESIPEESPENDEIDEELKRCDSLSEGSHKKVKRSVDSENSHSVGDDSDDYIESKERSILELGGGNSRSSAEKPHKPKQ